MYFVSSASPPTTTSTPSSLAGATIPARDSGLSRLLRGRSGGGELGESGMADHACFLVGLLEAAAAAEKEGEMGDAGLELERSASVMEERRLEERGGRGGAAESVSASGRAGGSMEEEEGEEAKVAAVGEVLCGEKESGAREGEGGGTGAPSRRVLVDAETDNRLRGVDVADVGDGGLRGMADTAGGG